MTERPARATAETHALEQPTPPRPPVAVKGGRDGLRVIVEPGVQAGAAAASLREQLDRRAGGFFLGASVRLELPPGPLDLALATRLAPVLAAAGMQLTSITAGPPAASGERRAGEAPPGPSLPSDAALWVAGTLRSGQRVAHAGAVVVVGDVNPGAEVVAGGSVIVWGRLRGTVEAGLAEGGDEAVVCALDLAPTQLRIGAAIARAPEDPGRVPVPEIAQLVAGRIVVAAWH